MRQYTLIFAAWLALMSIVAFVFMAIDKGKAKTGAWRVPEKTLFILALLGGGIGGWLGMRICHHKTKHWYFRLGFPLIAIIQIAALIYMMIV